MTQAGHDCIAAISQLLSTRQGLATRWIPTQPTAHNNACVCVQHLSCFLQYCAQPLPKGKRQLDCAGVVTTVLAICLTLSWDPEHAELAGCRFQVRNSHIRCLILR